MDATGILLTDIPVLGGHGGRWRGSYELIQAIYIHKIVVHMTTLHERIKGPRHDVFGPWPHHPSCTGVDALGICQYPR